MDVEKLFGVYGGVIFCQEFLLFAPMSLAEASAMAWWMQLRKEGARPKAHSALHGLGDSGRLERKLI